MLNGFKLIQVSKFLSKINYLLTFYNLGYSLLNYF